MAHNPETQNTSPEKQYVHHIIDLAKSQVRDTPEYQELRGRGMSHPNAFRAAAELAANNPENGLSDADRSLLNVVANLGVYVQAEQELTLIQDNTETGFFGREESQAVRHLKHEYAIPFNHHLKEFINTHPNDEIREVSSALTNAYGTIFGRYDCLNKAEVIYDTPPTAQEAFMQIQGALDGMRHEVAAEAMIDAAGYSYDHEVSANEDALGYDLFIYLESGWQGFDVKATQSAAEKHQARNRLSRAVWTGLSWGDFKGIKGTANGALSIPYSVATDKSDQFITNIYDMVSRYETQRSVTALLAGKSSLK